MTSLRNFVSNCIKTPLVRGQRVLIPAGTPMRSTHPSRDGVYYSKRKQYVTVFSSGDGWVDTLNDYKRGRGYVLLPYFSYPGSGGYWVDVKITPEFCEANGIETPALPAYEDCDLDRLDVAPAYGSGYDNRD